MPTATASLTSHYWDLQRIRNAQGEVRSPVQAAGQPAPRLTFIDGRIVASRLCNTMSGAYREEGHQLQVQQVMSTMIGCMNPEVVALERLVGSGLPLIQRYALQQEGAQPQLTLELRDGSQWQLQGTATPETRYGSAPQRIFLEVAAGTQPCTHGVIPNYQCLRVREIGYNASGVQTSTGEWHNFYETIEGFTQRPGERNVLRVNRYERKHVPADASRYAYVLDMIVESARAQ